MSKPRSVRHAFLWAGVESLAPQAITFGTSIVLARLLTPSDYGLVGMLTLFTGLAGVFVNLGFAASIVQKKDVTADDETSVFALNCVAGVGLAGLLTAAAPSIALFYGQPKLTGLLRLESVSLVVSALAIVPGTLLSRRMDFQKTAGVAAVTAVASGASGVLAALSGFGPWSLIIASLTAGAIRTALLWATSGWRPTGRVRVSCIRESWKFSSYLLYCQLIGVLYPNLYSVAIGKLYSPAALGFYDRANSLRMLPAGLIASVVGRVTFPLFSRHQDDDARLLAQLRAIVRSGTLLSGGGLALLAVLSPTLVPLLLGPKWAPSVPLLQILCVGVVLYPVSTAYLLMLQAKGHSNLNFKLESIKMVNGLVGVLLAYRFGVVALAWTAAGLGIVAYFINAWYVTALMRYRWSQQAQDILPTLGVIAVAVGAARGVERVLEPGTVRVLLAQTAMFIAILGAGLGFFRPDIPREIYLQMRRKGAHPAQR